MKKLIVLLLSLSLVMMALAGCKSDKDENDNSGKKTVQSNENGTVADTDEEKVTIRIGGLSGPTSMGLVKLMEDSANGETDNTYEFADLASDSSAFVAPLAQGEIDIAAVPSNLASVLYNNTDGQVQVIAVNTLCVLDVLERGESIQSMSDLKGKTIYATGQGATPEYTLRYLLSENGVNPDSDITIQWCSDTTEALSYITNDETAIAVLPQPFVTVALTKVEGLRIALDLNDEWTKLESGCEQVTGVLVVRTEFARQYPNALETFMKEYEASINFLSEDTEKAAELIEKYGIVAATVAGKALPSCHIVYETGSQMKESLSGFLQILYNENPASVGGSLPGDDFYYGN